MIEVSHGVQRTIYAESDSDIIFLVFDMDIAGALLDGVGDDGVDQPDDRRLARHVAQVLEILVVGVRSELRDFKLVKDVYGGTVKYDVNAVGTVNNQSVTYQKSASTTVPTSGPAVTSRSVIGSARSGQAATSPPALRSSSTFRAAPRPSRDRQPSREAPR